MLLLGTILARTAWPEPRQSGPPRPVTAMRPAFPAVVKWEMVATVRDGTGNERGVAMYWQPIETAPKDGTPILLHMRGEVTCGVYRRGEQWPWLVFDPGADESVNGWVDTGRYGPTEWMPLPDLPSN
jgi:hypothetical protein